MDKLGFVIQLKHATHAAINFARQHITNETSDVVTYCVYLGYDGPETEDLKEFRLFPEDKGKYFHRITAIEVVNLLWREDQVPVWIDIAVVASRKQETTMSLWCAGRYSGDEEKYYYRKRGTGPFGIKSPNLPYGYVQGELFTLPKRHWWKQKRPFNHSFRKVNWWRL